MNKYTDSNAKPIRAIKRARGYAYSKGQTFRYTTEAVDPVQTFGSYGWHLVYGTTSWHGTGPTYLFEPAFHGDSGYVTSTLLPPTEFGPPLSGTIEGLSSFEMALFIGAHEAAHQNGIAKERWADWYGAKAVYRYNADDGEKCK